MTESQPTGPDEQVGSVAEEAGKLLGALHGWAEEAGAGSIAAAVAMLEREWVGGQRPTDTLDEQPSTCRHCPLCRVVHLVQHTDPAVRAHLSSAATSLLHAGLALLGEASPSGAEPGRTTVEKITLDEA